ncbi:uncharacterized protein FA14DRAFT_161176 [Meira miltonrushii]|uniref:Uncharacterized protein n=1 Tax=Meira miltonrushii TaxID=1280837 RepID=A0A316VCC9_9BASI|nr:uncharacterized protein FA14DRAFT_161176 [Meira miltonrushii]PWN33205.1 hypothetical protein FA14DRAFT_161176 [Meira miltonrushii]
MKVIFIIYAINAFLICITFAGQMMQETESFHKRDTICPCGRKQVAGVSCLMRRRKFEQPQRLVKRAGKTGACQCLPCPKSNAKYKDPTGMPKVVKTNSPYEKAIEACVLKNTMTALKDPKAETPRCSEVVKDPSKKH